MDFIYDILNFIIKIVKWFYGISSKAKIALLFAILIPILWWKIPNPNSVTIKPLLGHAMQCTTTYAAKGSEIEVSASLKSELIGQMSSLSKHGDSIELISTARSLMKQNEKLKGTSKKIEVPIGAGKDSLSGVTVYAWKKTYRRFLTEDTPENTLFEFNLIIISDMNIMHFKGSRNDYFSLSVAAYIGTI